MNWSLIELKPGLRRLRRLPSQVPPVSSQASEKRGELESYAILTELAVAERRVPEINARVDRQRQLIEQLAREGNDITSAEIMLDSLLLSLFLAAEERHRLRAMLNTRAD